MLDSEFEVFPLGAEIDSGEVRTQLVVKTHLGVLLQRLVNCGYQHLEVVLSRHFALGKNPDDIAGKAFDNLDHASRPPVGIANAPARGKIPRMAVAMPRRISCRTISPLIASFIRYAVIHVKHTP